MVVLLNVGEGHIQGHVECSVPNVDGSIGGGGGGGSGGGVGGMRVAYSRIEQRNSATSEHARIRVKATRATGCWVHSPQLRHTSATLARGNCSHAPSSSHPIPSSTDHSPILSQYHTAVGLHPPRIPHTAPFPYNTCACGPEDIPEFSIDDPRHSTLLPARLIRHFCFVPRAHSRSHPRPRRAHHPDRTDGRILTVHSRCSTLKVLLLAPAAGHARLPTRHHRALFRALLLSAVDHMGRPDPRLD